MKEWLDQRNVSIVVVSFADPQSLAHYQKRHQWPFPILSDPNKEVYESFGLGRFKWFETFSFAAAKKYFSLLRKGRKVLVPSGDDIHQSGGDYIVNAEGDILFSHPNTHPADRPSVEKLKQAVENLK